MKTIAFLSLASSAFNAVNAVKFVSGPNGWAPAMGFNGSNPTWDDVEPIDRVSRFTNLAPSRQEMKPRISRVPGSKTVKLRYGPYTVPGSLL